MKERFVQILCCPNTKQSLILKDAKYSENQEIIEGNLFTAKGDHSYPIIKGIPRFVSSDVYSSSFSYEWKKWSRVQYESENTKSKGEGFTTKMFDLTTLFTDEDLDKKLVVEFGCGGGRYMDVALKKGATVVGIDLSLAVEPAYENLKEFDNYLIVQGDILNPPFKENTFDLGYCIGVLHHTPDPEKGLHEMFKTIKPGGTGVSLVYVDDGWYAQKSILYYRTFINKTRFLFGNFLATLYSNLAPRTLYYIIPPLSKVPLFGKRLREILERNVFVINHHESLEWRILDTFDAITPTYASTHSEEEVRSWFVNAGCRNIERTKWNKGGYRGVKPISNGGS
jgi:SAM-dependent methyltransferase